MRDVRTILDWFGRTLLVAGLVILGFVAYQLWGTNLLADRAQANLRSQFDSQATPTTATMPPNSTSVPTTTTTTVPSVNAPNGDAIAVIKIPRIELESTVVNGVSGADLRKGPGRYPQTVLPGEAGNAAIAGHRTTYGAPFGRLDELRVGDPIIVRTLKGTYTYRVSTEPFVVTPRQTEVLDPSPDTMLTLTTCHPKYSAAERLIVRARLDTTTSPKPLPPSPTVPATQVVTSTTLAGAHIPVFGLVVSVLLTLLIGAGWWFLFHRRPKWTTWGIGFAVFLPALVLMYYFVERSLPASY
ncbi:MAG: class E sortase [Acidimicrobiia bacterium]